MRLLAQGGECSGGRGVTIIEVLIVMGMISATWVIIAALLRYGLVSQRSQFEQGAITTTARVQVDRMTETIRAGDLLNARSYFIGVRSPSNQTIVYFNSGNRLRHYVSGVGWRDVRGVRNISEGVPMFRFYSTGGEKALELNPNDPDFRVAAVGRINIQLLLDIDTAERPGIIEVETEVTLRQ